ncbi:suppressor of fused domain protein [Corynebacterium lubricantis]|uniref:suppressor of fused domain protein n=1 Tax=Corynebacterium lubricantis TaxID=541095 RepID=UPI000525A156|nr:suppressor of fused domain protein [Corynebacterium lubricantis]
MSEWNRVFKRSRFAPKLGGTAIKAALIKAYGEQDPIVYEYGDAPVLSFRSPENSEIEPHYFYTTFGISRVHSGTPIAGTQTELTIRVAADEPLPPAWPAMLLNRVATYLDSTGNDLEPGHHMDFGVPLIDDSTLSALIFINDPALGIVETKTGPVRFTYAIGITARDLGDALNWDARKFAGVLGNYYPLGLTHPMRESLRENPQAHQILEKATDEQGSSLSAAMADYLDFTDDPALRIDITSVAAEQLLRAVRYRIRFGRSFALVSRKKWIEVVPGEGEPVLADDHLGLPVSEQLAAEILAVFDSAPGTYAMTTQPITIQVIDPNR